MLRTWCQYRKDLIVLSLSSKLRQHGCLIALAVSRGHLHVSYLYLSASASFYGADCAITSYPLSPYIRRRFWAGQTNSLSHCPPFRSSSIRHHQNSPTFEVSSNSWTVDTGVPFMLCSLCVPCPTTIPIAVEPHGRTTKGFAVQLSLCCQRTEKRKGQEI